MTVTSSQALDFSICSAVHVRRQRDAKGDQVVAEAERTVRNFGPDRLR